MYSEVVGGIATERSGEKKKKKNYTSIELVAMTRRS